MLQLLRRQQIFAKLTILLFIFLSVSNSANSASNKESYEVEENQDVYSDFNEERNEGEEYDYWNDYERPRILSEDLLYSINKLERPVENCSDAIVLNFGVELQEILDVDHFNEIIVIQAWLYMEWKDFNLQWDPLNYTNITEMRIPDNKIWKPDILLYNSAAPGFEASSATNIVVKNDGTCSYFPPTILKATCRLDLTWFPFDEQKCDFKFGSWTHDMSVMDLQLHDGEGDLSGFKGHGEWKVLGFPATRNVLYYACCPEPYVDVTYTLHLKRYPERYIYALIVPIIFISSMCGLSFLIPPDSSAKLIFGPATLLTLVYFLNSCALPTTKNDSAPLVTKYITTLLCMVFTSVVVSIAILNLDKRPKHKMDNIPKIFRKLFIHILPGYLFIKVPENILEEEHKNNALEQVEEERNEYFLLQKSQEEWKFVAFVLDRIFLIVFTIIIIISITGFLAIA